MKGGVAAAAVAALAGGANAISHRHAHGLFAKRGHGVEEVCVPSCTTIYSTIYGEPTLVPVTKAHNTTTSTPSSIYTPPPPPETTEAPPTSTEVVIVVPTPEVHKLPTPGTYTFPATTIIVDQTTTVCAAESTKVPSGTHTFGGVTTIVDTSTTVTCPYAKETTSNGVVTSVIDTTVYVCPTAGTYTIAPITTAVSEETVVVYPVPTSYAPGTYTAPSQVVTVTEDDFVYICPYTQEGLPTSSIEAPKPTKEIVAPKVEPTIEAVPEVKPTTKAPAPAPTKEEAPKYSAPTKQPSKSGELRGGNDHYGITYTPYQPTTGECKSSSEVDADIKSLKELGFSIVRSYSTDCNTLENVGAACKKYNLDLMIGVFVKGSGCSYETPDIKEQVDAIAEWAQWDIVKLFVVGNEAIMNGFCSASQLRELVKTVKEKCTGYTGGWTIAETLNIWQQPEVSAAICDVVDVTGANIHPYFNSAVSPEKAGEFVAGQLEILGNICKGNDVINLECGWPSQGNDNGEARTGVQEQAVAIKSIRESCGDKTVFFSFENDEWKEAGSCGCEKSWGSKACFTS